MNNKIYKYKLAIYLFNFKDIRIKPLILKSKA